MGARHLPDGRLFYGRDALADLPDYGKPCPQCGQRWELHAGEGAVSIVKIGGEPGYVMPACLETCSCCLRRVRLVTVMSVGVAVFCQECRPSGDVLGDWDQRVALVESLTGSDRPPCPHRPGADG
jgi:hypothetical protein